MDKAFAALNEAYQQSYPQYIWTARKRLCNQGLSVIYEGELEKITPNT